ncbi:hypothetical protein BD779DRAFT_1614346 [Infundibulicybe gibba]|nr:hypothetical protein BD779DRAFT_1614346 [Infundibulicybe gibba]
MASYEMRLNDDPATSVNRVHDAAHNLDKEDAVALAEVDKATPSMSQDLGLKLLFSWLEDVVGRKRTYGVELMIIIGTIFAQAFAGSGGGSHGAIDTITVLAIWRFIMGLGIGKDRTPDAITFPDLTATSVAALVAFVTVVASRRHLLLGDNICDPPSIDSMWRLLIGLDIECNIQRASDDIHNVMTTGEFPQDHDSNAIIQCARASRANFRGYFGQWDNMKVLIGMSYSWFVLGVASHGLELSSSVILQTANSSLGIHTESESTLAGLYANLINICGGNLILSASSILGHCTAKANTMVFLCCLANFFWDFGPNTTTPIIAGGAFPIRYRSTAYGISAAAAHSGIITQIVLAKLLEIFGLVTLTGIPSTLLLPETGRKTLEEPTNEGQGGSYQTKLSSEPGVPRSASA